jgi:small subunit ribosomal protein S1
MNEPQASISHPSHDEFAALLEESLKGTALQEGSVVKGTIVGIEKDVAVIDVGLKTEGRVPLKEFGVSGRSSDLSVGDQVDVYLERVENAAGEAVLSREKARREESWTRLEEKYKAGERVEGVIFNRVKGGFTVDLDGAVAFLPGSQVDIRPVRDVSPLMNVPQPFQILKMDRRRGNIVVSRRSVLEETRAEKRSEIVARLDEGQVIDGVVKNITDYGAFIDLGGIDGLLHVTDMAWRRVAHPSEMVNVGDTVKVQIIRINSETQRISLGMKQLEADPWEGIAAKYPVDAKLKGTVTNITDYGAFVELEPGVEGLIHVSEMSWTKKNIHPGKIISTSQEVEVQVLEVDAEKRRISLGLKQTQENPWLAFAATHTPGTVIEGPIRNITEFGLFVGLEGGIDGMVHLSDLDWSKPGEEALKDFNKGETVKAVVLEADAEKERISLGIKQLTEDPFATAAAQGGAKLKKGMRVTCEVVAVNDNGIEAKLIANDLTTFIRRSDLSRDRSEQRPDRFGVGEKFDALVTQFDAKARKVAVSIKALEISEEKEAVAQYGSTDSGASLGDILGAALNKAKEDDGESEEKPKRKSRGKSAAAEASED